MNETDYFNSTELAVSKVTDSVDRNARLQEIIVIYSIMLGATLVVYILRTFGFYGMCLQISLKLHDRLFSGITRTCMYFFNTNSSGRILNRFSEDTRTVDVDLPNTLMDCLSFAVDVSGVLIIVAIANYWLLVPAVVIVLLLVAVRYLYVNTSRSIKRIESISKMEKINVFLLESYDLIFISFCYLHLQFHI